MSKTGVLLYCFNTPKYRYDLIASKTIPLLRKNLNLDITVITDPDTGETFALGFIVGGDKPWINEFCGKMNMNAERPFVYCRCTQKDARETSHAPATHEPPGVKQSSPRATT